MQKRQGVNNVANFKIKYTQYNVNKKKHSSYLEGQVYNNIIYAEEYRNLLYAKQLTLHEFE